MLFENGVAQLLTAEHSNIQLNMWSWPNAGDVMTHGLGLMLVMHIMTQPHCGHHYSCDSTETTLSPIPDTARKSNHDHVLHAIRFRVILEYILDYTRLSSVIDTWSPYTWGLGVINGGSPMELLAPFDRLWDVPTLPGCLAEGEGPLRWSSREVSERLLAFTVDVFFSWESRNDFICASIGSDLLFFHEAGTCMHTHKQQ